jgi:hypothetical protein
MDTITLFDGTLNLSPKPRRCLSRRPPAVAQYGL